MLCPIDQSELAMAERQGVEIDYCPKCRGVWLDRGELDKIIERSMQLQADHPEPGEHEYRGEHDYRGEHEYRGEHDYRARESHKHRREGFLGNLFDF